MLHMLWKRGLVVILLFALFTLSSCTANNAGIIKNWKVENDILSWDAVDGATYYEILWYQNENSDSLLISQGYYVYDSNMALAQIAKNKDIYIAIRVHLSDGTTEDSEMMHFKQDIQFPYPSSIGGNYIRTNLMWYDLSDEYPSLINYTIKVNDEEYTVNTNEFDLTAIEANIYEIYVKANYTGGQSEYSPVYYVTHLLPNENTTLYYDPSLNQNLSFSLSLTMPVVYIHGEYVLNRDILDDSIITISGNDFILNRYYIESQSSGPYYGSIYIVTGDCIYTINIYDISMQDS